MLPVISFAPTDFNNISTDSVDVASDQTLLVLDMEQDSAALELKSTTLLPVDKTSTQLLSCPCTLKNTSKSIKLSYRRWPCNWSSISSFGRANGRKPDGNLLLSSPAS
uniref:Uncharacterized protein n=1 Tax=Arundo donax TaxID=35708 RepID=A0A0A9HHL7_ARUDO